MIINCFIDNHTIIHIYNGQAAERFASAERDAGADVDSVWEQYKPEATHARNARKWRRIPPAEA